MKYVAFMITVISTISCLCLFMLSISRYSRSGDSGFIFSGLIALGGCLVNVYLFRRYAKEIGWE